MKANPALAQRGMDRETGRYTTDRLAHIRQSLQDIFTTALGSRLMRRHYGSQLFEMMDAPMNAAGRLRLTAALVDAASRWEPRVTLLSALIDLDSSGRVVLSYHARLLDGSELESQVYLQQPP